MTLAKKTSRTIVIDNIKFRWLVSPNVGFGIFVAEKDKARGCKIEVHFKTDINSFWVEFPNVDNLNLMVIKPKQAEAIIRQALTLGWNPEEKGNPIVYELIDDKLVLKNKPAANMGLA